MPRRALNERPPDAAVRRPGGKARRLLALWRCAPLWLLVSCLSLLCSCRRQAPEEAAPEEEQQGVVDLAAPSSDAALEPPAKLSLGARFDVDGAVFGLGIDQGGNVLASTQRGRQAVYLVTPESSPDAPLAAVDLAGHGGVPIALSYRRFVLPIPKEARIEMLELRSSGTSPVSLDSPRSVSTTGVPSGVVAAFGSLWGAIRQSSDGRGLLRIHIGSGEIEESFETGPTPVEFTRMGEGEAERLFLTVLSEGGRSGSVVSIRGPQYGDGEPLSQVACEGVPLRVVSCGLSMAPGPSAFLIRHGRADLLPLGTETLEVGAPLALPFVPSAVLCPSPDVLVILGAEGRLARLVLSADGGELRVDVDRKVAPGSTELAIWGNGEALLLLDTAEQKLRLFSSLELEEIESLSLGSRPGRMVLDPLRGWSYVSLPQMEQVLRIEVRL